MGKSKATVAAKKRTSFGSHGGNRAGKTKRAAPKRSSTQAAGKDPQRGRRERG